MAEECIEFLSAVIVVSRDPGRLAAFYRDVVGLPLADERHGQSLPHFGCTLGDLHFAIHPVETFPDRRDGVGSVKLAFNVFDLQAFADRLTVKGVKLLYPPKDTGFFISTAIEDPDGNFIEFTQLVDEWFTQLEERKSRGLEVVSRWKAARGRTAAA
jgi:predicted enzyme related to lactoylglutathione lyase